MRLFLFFLILFFSNNLFSTSFFKDPKKQDKKLNKLVLYEIGTYSLGLVAMNELWYKNYPKSDFHFINDNSSWLQMDKMGHVATSYYSGINGIKLYRWAGVEEKKAIWFGGLRGTFYNSIVEVLDGFSKNWGASVGDLAANTFGSIFAISQELYWKEQKLLIKYSYSRSDMSYENEELFGDNFFQRTFKDYNGQTYWISMNVNSMLKTNNSQFPNWLNLAIGHSAKNMTSPNNTTNDGRFRQFFLSFDIDLMRIKTKNKVLSNLSNVFGYIKIPFPTLEFSNKKLKLHRFYF
tara:strand:+ start:107 stop:982 length:876 start_codon:yes stop_codon:yes gene_type:complete